MINKEEFLKTCNLTEDDLTAARISWEELTEIYEDYMSKTKLFRHLGKEFVDELSGQGSIPTVTEPRIQCTFWKRSSGSGKKIMQNLNISTNRITTNTSQI